MAKDPTGIFFQPYKGEWRPIGGGALWNVYEKQFIGDSTYQYVYGLHPISGSWNISVNKLKVGNESITLGEYKNLISSISSLPTWQLSDADDTFNVTSLYNDDYSYTIGDTVIAHAALHFGGGNDTLNTTRLKFAQASFVADFPDEYTLSYIDFGTGDDTLNVGTGDESYDGIYGGDSIISEPQIRMGAGNDRINTRSGGGALIDLGIGDDTITIDIDYTRGSNTIQEGFNINGGEGLDKLYIISPNENSTSFSAHSMGQIYPGYIRLGLNERKYGSIFPGISFKNVEEVYINDKLYLVDPITGYQVDEADNSAGYYAATQGPDKVVLSTASFSTAPNLRIAGFNPAEDLLLIKHDFAWPYYKSLRVMPSPPVLPSGATKRQARRHKRELKQLKKPMSTGSSFVYSSLSGKLYYDSNGIKDGFGQKGGLMAVLENQPVLSRDNFIFV